MASTNKIYETIKDKYETFRDGLKKIDRPEEPSWREAKDMRKSHWRDLAAEALDAADELNELLVDTKNAFRYLYVYCGPYSIGQTPEDAVRALEEHLGTTAEVEITDQSPAPKRDFDIGITWACGEHYRDGCLFEVPGGYILTHVDL